MPVTRIRIVPIWRTAPFIRLLVPMVSGIMIAYFMVLPVTVYAVLLTLSLAGLGWFFKKPLSFQYGFGICLFTTTVLLGMGLYRVHLTATHRAFIGNSYVPGSLLLAELTSPPEEKQRSWRAIAKVHQWDSANQSWQALSGGVLIYFLKDSLPPPVLAGNFITFKKDLQPIRSSGNPGAFDYARYAAENGWFFQCFLKQKEFIVADTNQTAQLRYWPFRARAHLLQTLRTYIPDRQTLGVAQALLTGYRNDMDKELAAEYAGSGVAHIIAISGLHLGMIQQLMWWLLMPLARLQWGKTLSTVLVIAGLWVFTFITGAGPAVLRAAFMFSFLLLGRLAGKEANKYNMLAASAFFILLYNPQLLFNVGFQLSYSAMLSIFIFSQPIGNLFHFQQPLVQKLWQILCVTLAAQVLTLPFVVYYFHQFPVYFLLANLVAIPLSWLALNLSLVLTLMCWWFPWVASWLGKGIHLSIQAMNDAIRWINALPMSRIEHIWLTFPQAVLLMAVIVCIACWLLLKIKEAALLSLAGLILLLGWCGWVWYRAGFQQKLVVYNTGTYWATDFIHGHKATFLGDTTCITNPVLFANNIAPARMMWQIRDAEVLSQTAGAFHLYHFGGKKILVLDKEPDWNRSAEVEADILLIATNLRAKPARVLAKIKADTIVATSQLPPWRLSTWQYAADSLHLHLHAIAENGAFMLDVHSPRK